jgi:hypothetical protein
MSLLGVVTPKAKLSFFERCKPPIMFIQSKNSVENQDVLDCFPFNQTISIPNFGQEWNI